MLVNINMYLQRTPLSRSNAYTETMRLRPKEHVFYSVYTYIYLSGMKVKIHGGL